MGIPQMLLFQETNKMVVKGNLPENDAIYYNEIGTLLCPVWGLLFMRTKVKS